ncbi:MAG: DUF1365 family protein [Actinophytocola sp.]|nr:DUF1365 family protein [Actinophytocola sp.]
MTALYEATVVHARRKPRVRAFRHRFYLWLVDVDALPRLPRPLAPFARFRAADHGDGRGATIREDLDGWLTEQGVDLRGGRVLMLASARVAGHVFNPLSVFWCYRDTGELACVVAEVHNTYGGRHRYLLHPDANGDDTTEKRFYVSPFLTVDGTYRLHVPEPGEQLHVTVTLDQDDGRVLTAVLRGRRLPATRRQLVRLLLRYPLAPLVVSAAIRLRGFALWLRGLPIVPRAVTNEEKAT